MNSPRRFVLTVNLRPVSAMIRVTTAPSTGCPLTSLTTPRRVPPCARTGAARARCKRPIKIRQIGRPYRLTITLLLSCRRKRRNYYADCILHDRQKPLDGRQLMDNRRGGQRPEKPAAVAFRAQARVEDGQDAAVAAMTDQSSKALQQGQNGQRHLVVVERFAAARADRIDARAGNRIGWR